MDPVVQLMVPKLLESFCFWVNPSRGGIQSSLLGCSSVALGSSLLGSWCCSVIAFPFFPCVWRQVTCVCVCGPQPHRIFVAVPFQIYNCLEKTFHWPFAPGQLWIIPQWKVGLGRHSYLVAALVFCTCFKVTVTCFKNILIPSAVVLLIHVWF